MTSGHFKPEAETTGSPALRLEIADQETKSPRLIPVLIRNLSTGGVTLAVTNPWGIADWDRYRGEDCVLRVEDPGGGEPVNIKAKIAWTRSGGTGQPPLSLGLQLIKPPGEAISRLSNLLPHTSQDIKGLWDRYDQVRESPGNRIGCTTATSPGWCCCWADWCSSLPAPPLTRCAAGSSGCLAAWGLPGRLSGLSGKSNLPVTGLAKLFEVYGE